jgi:hypothetical protein
MSSHIPAIWPFAHQIVARCWVESSPALIGELKLQAARQQNIRRPEIIAFPDEDNKNGLNDLLVFATKSEPIFPQLLLEAQFFE